MSARRQEGNASELRSGQFNLMVLKIHRYAADHIQAEMADQVESAPQLLRGAAVALDLGALERLPSIESLSDLLARLRYVGLIPVGLIGQGLEWIELARGCRIPLLAPERRRGRAEETPVAPPAAEEPAAPTPPPAAEAEAPAVAAPGGLSSPLVIAGPVRSGQQIYARGRDLIIHGTVSAGAEVAADGCVHVYGRLSGKALAGAGGDLRARVYCLEFAAELVSIAGNFRVFESAPRDIVGKTVEMFLDEGRLQIRALR